jgi:hypothetical protein
VAAGRGAIGGQRCHAEAWRYIRLVEFGDFGGFDGGGAFLAGGVFVGLLAIGEDAGELFIIVIRDDDLKLIVFAKRLAQSPELFSGEFHCKKGIMPNHDSSEKAGSTQSNRSPVPLRAR